MVVEGTSAGGTIRILGLPGSVREDSVNRRLLHAAALTASELGDGADVEIYEQPDLGPLPPFDPDSAYCDEVERLREAVADADAVLLSTPEYNGSIPGVLKNAIDWVADPPGDGPIRGKPTAVIGADRGEVGCDWAHADARKVLESAGARVLRDGLSICEAEEALDTTDRLRDTNQAGQLERVLEELVEEGRSP